MKKLYYFRAVIFIFATCCLIPLVIAQTAKKELKGLIIDATTKNPVAQAHIKLNNVPLSVSDPSGTFQILVEPNDTVHISFVGYQDVTYIVPRLIPEDQLTWVFVLVPGTLQLQGITISAKNGGQPANTTPKINTTLLLGKNNIYLQDAESNYTKYPQTSMDNYKVQMAGAQPVDFLGLVQFILSKTPE